MGRGRREIVAWVGAEVLPHEADLRAWLKRSGVLPDDVDDIVQEAYCRIAALGSVAHIGCGRAYLFQTARNIVFEGVRRARIVQVERAADLDALSPPEDELSPERIVAGRRELRRVQRLIEGLPERCRDIFKLRRVDGVPQKEIARRLGVTENVVEMQSVRGLRLILAALAAGEDGERAAAGQRFVDRAGRLGH